MAQIVFIINDDEDGVNITAASEPPVPENLEEATPAQAVAHLVANVVTAALSAPAEEAPQLEIVTNDADADGA